MKVVWEFVIEDKQNWSRDQIFKYAEDLMKEENSNPNCSDWKNISLLEAGESSEENGAKVYSFKVMSE